MSAFPPDISLTGHEIDRLFWVAFWLTGSTFLVVVGLLAYMILRYRARPGQRALYSRGENRGARLLTIGLALLVFVAIDVQLAVRDHAAWERIWGQVPAPETTLRVQVFGEQFAWNIRYAGKDGTFGTADDVVTLNQLHVPVNKTVVAQLSSKDVVHSFFLPNLRIKQDAVPGLVTSLYFQARKTGTFDIACAEHCGFGHYQMRGFLVVESQEGFDAWLAQQEQESSGADWGWSWRRA
ncbi:MAG: cytochrome c oxidase subunit II [Candidatus Omnitrophica bacterium]|nr:cytochrome c oxidase subunit II [Candidatus Omnitrophota bacterium]